MASTADAPSDASPITAIQSMVRSMVRSPARATGSSSTMSVVTLASVCIDARKGKRGNAAPGP